MGPLPKLISLSAALLAPLQIAAAATICMYTTDTGSIKQVNSEEAIPPEYRAQAKCFQASARASAPEERKETYRDSHSAPSVPARASQPAPSQAGELARPEEITLEGTIRREYMGTPLGNIELRWPRSVESRFGRTPSRAMADAARTVARIISKPAFPPHLRRLNTEWKVVFMDETLPETQIPPQLRESCHPGWMTPPANVYIVAQRVAGGCGGATAVPRVADSTLAAVLVHEMAHMIEYQLLGQAFGSERMRAEGFATWFTGYASDSSSVISKANTLELYERLAKESIAQSPEYFNFSGTAHDYARASMYFKALVDKRGLNTLVEVYKEIAQSNMSLFAAIEKRAGWSPADLDKEVRKMLKLQT